MKNQLTFPAYVNIFLKDPEECIPSITGITPSENESDVLGLYSSITQDNYKIKTSRIEKIESYCRKTINSLTFDDIEVGEVYNATNDEQLNEESREYMFYQVLVIYKDDNGIGVLLLDLTNKVSLNNPKIKFIKDTIQYIKPEVIYNQEDGLSLNIFNKALEDDDLIEEIDENVVYYYKDNKDISATTISGDYIGNVFMCKL